MNQKMNQKGIAPIVIILIIIGVLAVGGGVYYWTQTQKSKLSKTSAIPTSEEICKSNEVCILEKEESCTPMKSNIDFLGLKINSIIKGFQGNVCYLENTIDFPSQSKLPQQQENCQIPEAELKNFFEIFENQGNNLGNDLLVKYCQGSYVDYLKKQFPLQFPATSTFQYLPVDNSKSIDWMKCAGNGHYIANVGQDETACRSNEIDLGFIPNVTVNNKHSHCCLSASAQPEYLPADNSKSIDWMECEYKGDYNAYVKVDGTACRINEIDLGFIAGMKTNGKNDHCCKMSSSTPQYLPADNSKSIESRQCDGYTRIVREDGTSCRLDETDLGFIPGMLTNGKNAHCCK